METTPSLEDQFIDKEEKMEFLEKTQDTYEKIQKFCSCIMGKDWDIYERVEVFNMPIRNAAINYHMSRHNIRKACKRVQDRMSALIDFAVLFNKGT